VLEMICLKEAHIAYMHVVLCRMQRMLEPVS
jgi:hypothetical protein